MKDQELYGQWYSLVEIYQKNKAGVGFQCTISLKDDGGYSLKFCNFGSYADNEKAVESIKNVTLKMVEITNKLLYGSIFEDGITRTHEYVMEAANYYQNNRHHIIQSLLNFANPEKFLQDVDSCKNVIQAKYMMNHICTDEKGEWVFEGQPFNPKKDNEKWNFLFCSA